MPDEPIPYSALQPERCEDARGPAFIFPGEDEPRRCGEDPALPSASPRRYFERPVNLGYASLKRRGV
jgi:hypothetical protein